MDVVLAAKGFCFIPRCSFKWLLTLQTKRQMLCDFPPIVVCVPFQTLPSSLKSFHFFLIYQHGNTHVAHDPHSFISFVSGENVPGWKVMGPSLFERSFFCCLGASFFVIQVFFFFHGFPYLPEKDAKWKDSIDSLSSVGHRLFQKASVRKMGFVCVCVWYDISSGVNQH